jgi:hypothetical protein
MSTNEQIAICRKIKAGLPHTQKEAELYCRIMKRSVARYEQKPIDFSSILMISMAEKERRDAAEGMLNQERVEAGVHRVCAGVVD